MNFFHWRAGLAGIASAAVLVIAVPAYSARAGNGSAQEFRQEVRDAWITGKIETIYTLNRQLNSFDIDTKVEAGVVQLTGTVETEVERELATALAKSVEGVSDVRNELKIASPSAMTASRRVERENLARVRAESKRSVEDASTSAIVKSKLAANQNTKGLEIRVETRNRVVTLSGQVRSAEERQLAELLARNTDDVAEVKNELSVDGTRSARTN